jgi:hypothetical protein
MLTKIITIAVLAGHRSNIEKLFLREFQGTSWQNAWLMPKLYKEIGRGKDKKQHNQ